jgi:hypothetical protein
MDISIAVAQQIFADSTLTKKWCHETERNCGFFFFLSGMRLVLLITVFVLFNYLLWIYANAIIIWLCNKTTRTIGTGPLKDWKRAKDRRWPRTSIIGVCLAHTNFSFSITLRMCERRSLRGFQPLQKVYNALICAAQWKLELKPHLERPLLEIDFRV